MRAELRRKGVDQGLVEAALEAEGVNAEAAAEGADSLLATARRRFGAQFVSDPEGAERRLAGFLVRRGYDWDTVGRVARALRLEAGAELDADPDADSAGRRLPKLTRLLDTFLQATVNSTGV